MAIRIGALILLVVCLPAAAEAQLRSDTLFTWQGYGRTSTCRVRVYRSGADQKEPHTVVIDEIGENEGASTLDDVQHLVELVGRRLAVDPEEAYWVFHWGAFSHGGAGTSSKELFFRATFRRSDSGALGTPFWRLINRETVVEYTDRAFR